jgi:predicted signal transduction protein with EAL and GGDEF domain
VKLRRTVQLHQARADGSRVDRPAVVAIVLGVVAAASGAAALLAASAPLGALAGVAGLMAAALAVTLAGRQRVVEQRVRTTQEESDLQRRELRRLRDSLEDVESRLEWYDDERERRVDETDQLTDPESGLLAEGWFVVALDSRVASARRHLRPVAVVRFEVVVGLSQGLPLPADPTRVAKAVIETIREADDAFRLHDGSYALLLEDTSDAGATWTIERVRHRLEALEPRAVLWAGVSCYPAHGLTTDEVFSRADSALAVAREWRQPRIEIARSEM